MDIGTGQECLGEGKALVGRMTVSTIDHTFGGLGNRDEGVTPSAGG